MGEAMAKHTALCPVLLLFALDQLCAHWGHYSSLIQPRAGQLPCGLVRKHWLGEELKERRGACVFMLLKQIGRKICLMLFHNEINFGRQQLFLRNHSIYKNGDFLFSVLLLCSLLLAVSILAVLLGKASDKYKPELHPCFVLAGTSSWALGQCSGALWEGLCSLLQLPWLVYDVVAQRVYVMYSRGKVVQCCTRSLRPGLCPELPFCERRAGVIHMLLPPQLNNQDFLSHTETTLMLLHASAQLYKGHLSYLEKYSPPSP